MELLKHTTEWAKGDAFQGKFMIITAILLLIACVFILRADNSILKGTLIPLSLLIIICGVYGGFLTFSRPKHIVQVEETSIKAPQETVNSELLKAEEDNKAYSMIKKLWPILILLSTGLYYLASTNFLKGLSIGFLSLFTAALIIDSLLHYRLQPYLQILKELNK